MDKLESILRKHFQATNREGMGFLERNINGALADLRELCPQPEDKTTERAAAKMAIAREWFRNQLMELMKWNAKSVTDAEDGSFTYTGMPGQSLIKDIKKACGTIALHSIGVYWITEPIYRREGMSDEHDYRVTVRPEKLLAAYNANVVRNSIRKG